MIRPRKYIKSFTKYVLDSSVDIKDRAFMVFSVTLLAGMFLAIPCGIIMHEPLVSTVSTIVGEIIFSIYVWYSFVNHRIDRARVVISFIIVFFLCL